MAEKEKEKEKIKIHIFDINGEYEENTPVDNQKNLLLLDSPIRIIDLYFSQNVCPDLKKNTDDQYKIEYEFSYEIKENSLISICCDIINNFSVYHQGTLESNGYIVFCNLENKLTFELLEKMGEYIKENCSINVKTYIIGVFKENISEDKEYNKMRNFLKDLEFEFEYYEMYLGDKVNFEMISKDYDKAGTMEDILKDVFNDIYYKGHGPKIGREYLPKEGLEDRSMAKCNIF